MMPRRMLTGHGARFCPVGRGERRGLGWAVRAGERAYLMSRPANVYHMWSSMLET